MTIGAWIGLVVIVVIGYGVAAGVGAYMDNETSVSTTAIAIICCAIVLVTAIIASLFFEYRSSSASGQRALKDQQSNLNGGIERVVRVYDVNGEMIEQYEGRFDVETDRETYI